MWSSVRLAGPLILRPLREDAARTVLTILSIALGVAVVIAIELAGDAATGSFQSSLTTLVGKVDYDIQANAGVDENVMGRLAALPIDARFSPVIEQPVIIEGAGSTTVYGIDAVASMAARPETLETAAVASSELANRLDWKMGQRIVLLGRGFRKTFEIQSIAPGQNTEWVGIDIAAAQQVLGMYGNLDRVEVFLGPNQRADEAERAIRSVIPASYTLETPGARSEENRRMLRAFRWNLRILSYISLLVGAFLIYNTISVGVARRRTEIGILRALGTRSRGVLALFLGEAAALGLVGSFFGIGLGRVLAGAILGMISDTVNALFTTSAPSSIYISAGSFVAAVVTGTAVAVVSALIPAREAARIAPAEAMRREARQRPPSCVHSCM